MAANIQITDIFTATLADGSDSSTPRETLKFAQNTALGVGYNVLIPNSDTTLDLGSITTIGLVKLNNLQALVLITTPSTPVITNHGAAGATNDSYKIVAKQTDGAFSAASSAGSTSTANATLDTSNYNVLTWTPDPNATAGYDIYRTVAGGTPSSTGKIGSVAANIGTFNDTGLAGDSGSVPSTGTTNKLRVGHTSGTYMLELLGGDMAFFRGNPATLTAIHCIATDSGGCKIQVRILND